MKASIQISTKLMIGSWEPSDDEHMMQDALNKGIPASDVELREVTHDEHMALISARDAVTMSYADKRIPLYPPMQNYIDAKVKQSDPDPAIQAAGVAQEQAYCAACRAVKQQIPKD
jgi:hypothetical protein